LFLLFVNVFLFCECLHLSFSFGLLTIQVFILKNFRAFSMQYICNTRQKLLLNPLTQKSHFWNITHTTFHTNRMIKDYKLCLKPYILVNKSFHQLQINWLTFISKASILHFLITCSCSKTEINISEWQLFLASHYFPFILFFFLLSLSYLKPKANQIFCATIV